MKSAYDEATLDLLRLTIPTYGILVPVIYRAGTNEIIDGRHRLKVREELEAEGMRVMLPVHHVDTDNPEKIDQIVNSVRRPWQDTEQRRKLVAQLREKGHSHQRIADAVGTHKKTVQNDLKADAPTGEKAPVGADKSTASTGKDGKTRKQPATPEEIAKAWAMRDSGMSTAAIAQDLNRGKSTVRDWFTKERPQTAQQSQPSSDIKTPIPSADTTPDPPFETSENRMFEPKPLTPTGELSDEVKALIKREQQSMAERVSSVRHLRDFNQAAIKHWEYLQRKYKSQGRSVIAHNMKLASISLRQDKALQPWAESLGIPVNSSYEDCIWATIKLARDLDKSMRLSLYLAGFIDAPGQMDRLHDS
jgi:transposase